MKAVREWQVVRVVAPPRQAEGEHRLHAQREAEDAKADEAGSVKEVAQQFEAMFVQMMLKSMRAAVPKNESTSSKTMETFEQMRSGEVDGTSAFMQGKLKVSGDMSIAMKLQSVMDALG